MPKVVMQGNGQGTEFTTTKDTCLFINATNSQMLCLALGTLFLLSQTL